MSLLLDFTIFFSFIIFSIYPLGKLILILLKIKTTFWEEVIIGINIGNVIFTLIIFFLWRLNLHVFTYLLLLPGASYFFYMVYSRKFFSVDLYSRIKKIDPILVTLLFISTITPSLLVIKSGDVVSEGLRMIGANGHDILSYFGLINNLQKSLPPENPTFSGEQIKNYHYLTYILFSAIQYITKIPLLDLYFKILLPMLSFLFAASVYILIKNLTKIKSVSYLTIIFTCLSSNLYYISKLFYPSAFSSPSVFWIDEYTTRMVNPQLLLSYIIILTIFYLILKVDMKNLKSRMIVSMLIGSLFLVKVFSGILIFITIGLLSLYQLIRGKRGYFFVILISSFVTLVLYLVSNTSLSSSLIFSPLWFIKNIFESPDHLNFSEWELKRQTFLEKGNYIRIIQLYLQGITIYLFGNLGIKILGFFQFVKKPTRENEIIILLMIVAFFGLILPQLFLVRGTTWNSIQFSYYSVFVLSFLTPLVLYRFLGKYKLLFFLIFLVSWISLLPGIYYTTNNYFISVSKSDVFPKNIYEATLFLRTEEDGVVLIHPSFFNDTFIPAFSYKTAFFADEMWLSVQTTPFARRKKLVVDFFENPSDKSPSFLKENNIKYIFSTTEGRLDLENIEVSKIYQNALVTIFKII